MKHNFYKTDGRNILYAIYNKGLDKVVENWKGTQEVKVSKGYLFITDRAFNYVPELLEGGVQVVNTSKEEERAVRELIKLIEISDPIILEGTDCWDDYGREVREVITTATVEVEDIYVEVSVRATGQIYRTKGDQFTPSDMEVKWGEMDLDELKVWIGEMELTEDFNMVQEKAILNAVKQRIELR